MKKFLALMVSMLLILNLTSVQSFASDDDSDMRSSSSSSSDDDSDDDDDDDDSDDDKDDDKGEWDDSGMDSDDDLQEKANHNTIRSNKATISGSGTELGAGKATFKEFTVTKKTDVKERMNGSGAMSEEDKEMLKMKREEMKNAIEGNREEAKGNREDFREENEDDIEEIKSNLTEEQIADLKDLHEQHKADIEAIREDIKSATTQEAREALYDELKALAETHYNEVKAIVGDGLASELVEDRKAVWEENESLRDENRTMKGEYREVKRTTVEKYRKIFIEKLGNSLDKIPAEKFPQIIERINAMMEKSEDNPTMMAALVAILELVEEKMEGDDIEADVFEVVETLINE